jgi:ATP-dependent Clp protease protease subunit
MKVFILEPITSELAARLVPQIEAAGSDEIEVVIFSYGGDVMAGNAILYALRNSPARIVTNVIGVAASMAAVISQAGDVRRIAPDGSFNVHMGEAQPTGRQTAEAHIEAAEMLNMFDDLMIAAMDRSKLDDIELRGLMAQDRVMGAEEALTLGFFDEFSEPVQAVAQLNNNIHMNRIDSIMARLKLTATKAGAVKAELTEDEAVRLGELEAMETRTPEEDTEMSLLIEKRDEVPEEVVVVDPPAAEAGAEVTGADILTAEMVKTATFNAFAAETRQFMTEVIQALGTLPKTEDMIELIEAQTTEKLDSVLTATKSKTVIPAASQNFKAPEPVKTTRADVSIINAMTKKIHAKNKR